MSIKNLFSITLFFILIVLNSEAEPGIITVNYPPDKTVMDLDLLSVSVSIPQGSADLLKISVNDEQRMSIVPRRSFECFSVSISVGRNSIAIDVLKNSRQVDKVTFTVFRRSGLLSAYKDAPAGFKKDFFHMKDRSACAECHVLEPRDSDKQPINISTFAAETDAVDRKANVSTSTCYSCHMGIASYPFVHGPASVWSCLTCHDPEAERIYSVKKPDSEICFTCHLEQKQSWSKKKYLHGPVNMGNCSVCHNPHASNSAANLVEPIWELCISCHAGKETGRHIIAGYVFGDSHPTRDKPEPLRQGKELSCASCHNPHASDYPKLWALNAQSAFVLCQKCHQK
jgi:predicted CXXCH cytochrome family protein